MGLTFSLDKTGGGPRVVVSTAAFHARVRFPVLAVWKKQKMFLPHPRVKVSIVWSLRYREVACSASDRQGSNFESCVWRTVSSQSYHLTILAQFSLYVHKGGLQSLHFIFLGQDLTHPNLGLYFWVKLNKHSSFSHSSTTVSFESFLLKIVLRRHVNVGVCPEIKKLSVIFTFYGT